MSRFTAIERPLAQSTMALVRMPELMALTGLARPTVYKLLQRDPTFPRPVKLSDSGARNAPVGFVLSEVQAWIQGRIAAREQRA
ncbi:helix-turn-helix transcriptional regulator [Pseudomonas oryzihabitans]|uniref:Prophage regulatory protein n=1 Tax=Pseudomonas oryzihabitans TaxID=47885 RepID=A0AAJ2BZ42_9PSED|nr:AlpA family phage regulatory protein [Pseudomonas psychrotolerans]MDR6235328.1 prophage regulatory protein [Pseudomonas psychrotolerans]MDR6355441.1 prophage regulatory protein [Pseudomonas psychrotolerans]